MTNNNTKKQFIIVDVGCGYGFQVSTLNKTSINIGIDKDYDNIKICVSRYPKVLFCVMDAQGIAFRPQSISHIIMHDVLEHVENPDLAMTEAHSVLTSNGICDCKVPTSNTEQILNRVRPSYLTEIGHLRIFAKEDIIDLITRNHYTVLSYKLTDALIFIELFVVFFFTKHIKPNSDQVNVFNWRNNAWMFVWHVFLMHFNPVARHTPLRWSPFLSITLGLGALIEKVSPVSFPKSQHIICRKNVHI